QVLRGPVAPHPNSIQVESAKGYEYFYLREHAGPLIEKVHDRFRELLFRGKLNGYYFSDSQRKRIANHTWATSATHGVIETGDHYPYGRLQHSMENRPPVRVLIRS